MNSYFCIPVPYDEMDIYFGYWSMNFRVFKLDLEKAEEPEIKLPTSAGSSKKQESSRKNIYFCFIDYVKAFDCVDHNKLENS